MTGKRFKFFRGEDRTPMIYDNKMEKYYFCVDLDSLSDLLNALHEENENRKAYQRTLEAKIRRLKERIKVLEK